MRVKELNGQRRGKATSREHNSWYQERRMLDNQKNYENNGRKTGLANDAMRRL